MRVLLAVAVAVAALAGCGGETRPPETAPTVPTTPEGVTEEAAQEAVAELFVGEADVFTSFACDGPFPLGDGESGTCEFEYTTDEGDRCTGRATVVTKGRAPFVEDELLRVDCANARRPAPQPSAEGLSRRQAEAAIAELLEAEAERFTSLECRGDFPLPTGEAAECEFAYTTPTGERCEGTAPVVAVEGRGDVNRDFLPISCD